jgi:hypothetical protein
VGHLVGVGFVGHRVGQKGFSVGQKGFRDGTRVGRYVTPQVGFIVSVIVAGEKDAVAGGASGVGDGVGGFVTMGTHPVWPGFGVSPVPHVPQLMAPSPEKVPGAHFMHILSGLGE